MISSVSATAGAGYYSSLELGVEVTESVRARPQYAGAGTVVLLAVWLFNVWLPLPALQSVKKRLIHFL